MTPAIPIAIFKRNIQTGYILPKLIPSFPRAATCVLTLMTILFQQEQQQQQEQLRHMTSLSVVIAPLFSVEFITVR